jgi:uncharacterized protein YndB with AHSA1/START domain
MKKSIKLSIIRLPVRRIDGICTNRGGKIMVRTILIAAAVIVLAFLVVVAVQPSDFRITRSIKISAPPDVVFAQVNDLHNMDAWSPWLEPDPAAKKTFEGPRSGEGAAFAWAGNNEVGEGRLTITESRPYDLVRMRLDFVKPIAGTDTAEFTFRPEGGETVVTWSMYGKQSFLGKAVCLFMDMEKMVGGNFEKGLSNMKSIAEGTAKN